MRKAKNSEFVKILANDKNLPAFDDAPIRKAFEEDAMPKIERSPVGRLRLIKALEFRYGQNFRNFEVPSKVLEHFDGEMSHLRDYIRIKRKSIYG